MWDFVQVILNFWWETDKLGIKNLKNGQDDAYFSNFGHIVCLLPTKKSKIISKNPTFEILAMILKFFFTCDFLSKIFIQNYELFSDYIVTENIKFSNFNILRQISTEI